MEAYSNGELAHDRGTTLGEKAGKAFPFRACEVSQGCDIREGLCGVEVIPSHDALEGGAVNTKGLGRLGDVSAILLEGLLEELLL